MKKIINALTANKYRKSAFMCYSLVVVCYILTKIAISAGLISNSLQGQLVPICTYITVALALNLVVGISGELSLGHAGFMAVGAFTSVIAATVLQNSIDIVAVRLIVAMLIGGLFAGISGVIIGVPVLRLRGDYLAIVTLAFGEIIRNIMNIVYVGMDEHGLQFATKMENINITENGRMILSGPMGATGITKLSSFDIGFVLILFTLFVVLNLINSKQGRAIMAMRDNRIAAESVGLSATGIKLTAFITSAIITGMAGALFALNYSTIAPVKFTFNTSILVLVFVVLGGIGNMFGSIISAAILTVLPEALRQFADYRMLTYAIVLILVMVGTYSPAVTNARARLYNSTIGKIKKNPKNEKKEGGAQ